MTERQSKILEMIIELKRVDVNDLAEHFGVSQVTIRKDLDQLESSFMIKREHGYAVLNESDDINLRLATHFQEKLKIAEKAATLVEDGETIFIESGSCCALLAREIAKLKKDVTIITNSTFIAGFIKVYDSVKVYLSGGELQRPSGVLIGPMASNTFKNFFVHLAFIGVDGYLSGGGFYGNDINRGEVVREMVDHSKTTCVVTDSTKFNHTGLFLIKKLDKNTIVITDSKISEKTAAYLKKEDVKVILASV